MLYRMEYLALWGLGEKRLFKLVFIGNDLDENMLMEGLEASKASS